MTRRPQTAGSVDELDNAKRRRVLGIIDQFTELSVNEDIFLPLGSSLWSETNPVESLHFSRASRASASQSQATYALASPLKSFNAAVKITKLQKQHILAFEERIEGHKLSSEEFASILDKAAVHIGLPSVKDKNLENLTKRFSHDILKVELCSPQHHHLSVVDVPGLFHKDLDIIRAFIKSYMTDPQTIILAVMDARNNLANQEVFRMVRCADPQGLRTVGIITKCDALQPGDE
ncbi:hypothetical protein MMC21_005554 [Puttea exsequens]|nr:hypothetical protein [Puttea exsequens]